MTRPAVRVGDAHTCPIQQPFPHGGGPVQPPGARTVLAEHQPVARVSDPAQCIGAVGGPDAIASGCGTVLVERQMAARQGDATQHGGVLIGAGTTVLIGETRPTVTVVRRGNVFIIVDRANHRIVMVGRQEYHGSGATAAYAARATASINSTWSGPTTFEGHAYTAEALITGGVRGEHDTPHPMANQIRVVQTNQPHSVNSVHDPSNQPYYGRGEGYQHSTDNADGCPTSAHEFGHAIGLRDRYTETRDANGNRVTVPTDPPGSLMGRAGPGTRPLPRDYDSLITGNDLLP